MIRLCNLKIRIAVCCGVAAALSLGYACYSPNVTGPEEMYLEDLLAGFAEGHGCVALRYPGNQPANIECRDQPHEGIPSTSILVDKVTDCKVTGADVPTWNFGYDFRFERLGQTKLGMWIYEGYGDFTYIVKDRKLVDFCKGRVQPTEAFPPCSCADSGLVSPAKDAPTGPGEVQQRVGIRGKVPAGSSEDTGGLPTPTAHQK